jgi:CHASE3 domain sensor protein
MSRRLTFRTLAVSALLIVVVGAVLGAMALGIDRQHDAGERARHSQTVIATANLAEQRLLAVQSAIRGFLIHGNPKLLSDYRAVRESLPAAALDLQGLVADNPGQSRLAQEIRREALAYVDTYAHPVTARTREAGVGAGRAFATAHDGGARADELEALIGRFGSVEQKLSEQRAKTTDSASSRALLTAGVGFALLVLVLVLATTYVARRIVLPVGRLAAAASRVQRGELDVTVPERRGDEIGRLGRAFNAMARALEQNRGELESQNTELEMQAIELEERRVDLTEANDEARAQRDELEISASHLAAEKARAGRYGEFADRLATSRNASDLAEIALSTLAAAAGADVGVLYTHDCRDETRWARTAVLALDPAPLAEFAPTGGEGAGARAVASRSVVVVDASGAPGSGSPPQSRSMSSRSSSAWSAGPRSGWAEPGSVWLWRTRSSWLTAVGWASRAPRAPGRASGSRCPPDSHCFVPNVCQKAHMCSLRPMLPLACSP